MRQSMAAILVLVVAGLELLAPSVSAQKYTDKDFDPTPGKNTFDWANDGFTMSFSTLDKKAGKVGVFKTQAIIVYGNWVNAVSCQDNNSPKKDYPHWYFQKNYQEEKGAQELADAFWDFKFGADIDFDNPAKTTRKAIASVNYNCYRFALQAGCAGKWEAFLDHADNGGAFPAAIPGAFDATCTQEAKIPSKVKDILYYTSPEKDSEGVPWHCSVVWGVVDQKPSILRFRGPGSGEYEFVIPAGKNEFDTPGRINVYTFSWNLVGANELLYKGKVYRPK